LVGIEALGDGDETDAVGFQGLDVAEAIYQTAAEAVEGASSAFLSFNEINNLRWFKQRHGLESQPPHQ
jgi:hypothetical protein